MNTELRKRLEEAVKTILKIIHNGELPWYHASEEKAIRCGAEYGYKEAIKVAKEWLEEKVYEGKYWGRDDEGAFLDADELLVDFESNMNKLWEEDLI